MCIVYLAAPVTRPSPHPHPTRSLLQKADIWSCGVLLYVIVTGLYPFRRPGDEALKPNQCLNAMLQRILKADYSFPPQKNLRCSAIVAAVVTAGWTGGCGCACPVQT